MRSREKLIGYWSVLDAPVATERLSLLGYDYVAIDMQHGLVDYGGLVSSLMAVDAGRAAGVVRVGANDATLIGRALDAGAAAVIVPLVNSADDAARAVSAARYAPVGVRSYGPMRSGLRIGPTPRVADDQTAVVAMIETTAGLAAVEDIAQTPGLTGLYVGPSDLTIALGGGTSTDSAVAPEFEAALARVAAAAAAADIAAGIHTPSGEVAHLRLGQGFTFASIASDLTHLEAAARAHLDAAR
jgi:4-hydroxy-2-oxoheptanedioate aldolase